MTGVSREVVEHGWGEESYSSEEKVTGSRPKQRNFRRNKTTCESWDFKRGPVQNLGSQSHNGSKRGQYLEDV